MLKQIKKDVITSMKSGDKVKTSILRLVVSECDLIRARTNSVTDDDVIKVIEKLVKSIQETLKLATKKDDLINLVSEISILESFLPKKLTLKEIKEKLDGESIMNSKNVGMAIGVAMKQLKGLSFNNADVKLVVEEIRNVA
jgi:uncharacterized protein YqeY